MVALHAMAAQERIRGWPILRSDIHQARCRIEPTCPEIPGSEEWGVSRKNDDGVDDWVGPVQKAAGCVSRRNGLRRAVEDRSRRSGPNCERYTLL